jgi:hypothetical protein
MSTTNGLTRTSTAPSTAARSARELRWEARSQVWASSLVHLAATTALLFLLGCVVAGTALFAL